MTPIGQVGDIWRFEPPEWNRTQPVAHYLITDILHRKYRNKDFLYVATHLESGTTIGDLLLDESNLKNYNAHKVA